MHFATKYQPDSDGKYHHEIGIGQYKIPMSEGKNLKEIIKKALPSAIVFFELSKGHYSTVHVASDAILTSEEKATIATKIQGQYGGKAHDKKTIKDYQETIKRSMDAEKDLPAFRHDRKMRKLPKERPPNR